MPKITLHYTVIPASRAERIFWLLEELGVEYDVKAYVRDGFVASGLKAVSGLGKTPVLEVDGRIMTETGFMVHYLLAHIPHPGLEQHPSDDSYFWSHFSEGTMMLHLQPALLLSMGAEGLAKKGGTTESQAEGINILYNWFNNGWVGKNLPLQLAEVEDFLSRHPNFSGTQSLGQGDFMMSYPINSLAYGNRKGMFEVGPHTMAWIHRIRARPGWKRAYERLRREDRLAKL